MARKLERQELNEIWMAARLNCGIPLAAQIPLPLIELVAEVGRLVEEKVWEINKLQPEEEKTPGIMKP